MIKKTLISFIILINLSKMLLAQDTVTNLINSGFKTIENNQIIAIKNLNNLNNRLTILDTKIFQLTQNYKNREKNIILRLTNIQESLDMVYKKSNKLHKELSSLQINQNKILKNLKIFENNYNKILQKVSDIKTTETNHYKQIAKNQETIFKKYNILYSLVKKLFIFLIFTFFIFVLITISNLSFILSLRRKYSYIKTNQSSSAEEKNALIQKQESQESNDETKYDHSLIIKIADEIFRMKIRLSQIDEKIKNVKALKNTISRLEDELHLRGYKIVDLTGIDYIDGMTVDVKLFVPDESLPAGTFKISRTIKPQIEYMGNLIRPAEVEVVYNKKN